MQHQLPLLSNMSTGQYVDRLSATSRWRFGASKIDLKLCAPANIHNLHRWLHEEELAAKMEAFQIKCKVKEPNDWPTSVMSLKMKQFCPVRCLIVVFSGTCLAL